MSKETKYFNFPIELLSGYLEDRRQVLKRILYYSLYDHSLKLEYGEDEEKIEASAEFFNVSLGGADVVLAEGEELFNSLDPGGPKVGINTDIYWDYRNNYKTDFEDACLLAFLGLKSIIQNHAMCKVTNLFWLSRMDGNTRTVAAEFELSERLLKYSKEYQLKKIKDELMENWGLVYYGRYTRGFYISFKMSYKDLVTQVEKKRQSRKKKEREKMKKDILKEVLANLEKE